MRTLLASAVFLALLAGCTSMSGLSGSSSYACKSPEGVACDSVSGTYANALQNNLPSQRRPASKDGGASAARADLEASTTAPAVIPHVAATGSLPPTPVTLRSAPRVLRLWIKPWEDADHDLHDQSYVYVQVDGGSWQVEHVRRQIRDAYAPLKAPPRPADAKEGTPAPSGARVIPRPGPAAAGLLSPPSLPGADPRAIEHRGGKSPDEVN
ncbi:MAG: type IV conjugative transfer system protein TraV [Burkholderiaceae bacterium]|jgi:conjugal transfer pilus assembly protein TraV|nr:MAG: type IV conjugative transfer system protein TraV [Burkholderiaceae bacterium]